MYEDENIDPVEETKEVALEDLPIHALRTKCKDMGIVFKTTDKKKELITMILSGETAHKPREIKRAPVLQDQKTKQSVPLLPKNIMPQLEELKGRGLTWEINEKDNTVRFMRDLPVTANLDQSEHNILNCAKQAFGRRSALMPLGRADA